MNESNYVAPARPEHLTRRGIFYINAPFLHDPKSAEILARCVFAKTVIVRAEYLFSSDRFVYEAYSPLFEIVSDPVLSPEYEWIFGTKENGSVVAAVAKKK